jgi:small subunit ribosomal protein S11
MEEKAVKPTKEEKATKAVKEEGAAKAAPVEEKAEKATKAAAKKKIRKTVALAHAYITATYNNTMISISEPNGNVLVWSSSGANGFKGTRKSTPYAATVTAEKAVERAKPYGIERLKVFINGVGTGREQAVRGLHASGLEIEGIFDTTPLPHNGCRKKKSRRV